MKSLVKAVPACPVQIRAHHYIAVKRQQQYISKRYADNSLEGKTNK